LDTDVILTAAGRIFKDNDVILVPCLYIILWFVKQTPIPRHFYWIVYGMLIIVGMLISCILCGFDLYNLLIGFAASCFAILIHRRQEDHRECKCNETGRKKNQKPKTGHKAK